MCLGLQEDLMTLKYNSLRLIISQLLYEIPLAPMWFLPPCLRMHDVSACPPMDRSGHFLAHMSAVTIKHLPQPLSSHIRSFGTLGQLFKIPPFPPKYVILFFI
jgi:hypothetical protein